MPKKSNTSLTRSLLENEGWTVDVTEHWVAFAKVRRDLFNFGDLFAFNDTQEAIVQCTSYAHIAARRAKIQANPVAARWVANPDRKILLIGWKKGKRGEGMVHKIEEVVINNFK